MVEAVWHLLAYLIPQLLAQELLQSVNFSFEHLVPYQMDRLKLTSASFARPFSHQH